MDVDMLHYYVDEDRFAFHLNGRHYIMEESQLAIEGIEFQYDPEGPEIYDLVRDVAERMNTDRNKQFSDDQA